jgi:hypothetical protein
MPCPSHSPWLDHSNYAWNCCYLISYFAFHSTLRWKHYFHPKAWYSSIELRSITFHRIVMLFMLRPSEHHISLTYSISVCWKVYLFRNLHSRPFLERNINLTRQWSFENWINFCRRNCISGISCNLTYYVAICIMSKVCTFASFLYFWS